MWIYMFPGLITNIKFPKALCFAQNWCSMFKWKFHHLLNIRNFKDFGRSERNSQTNEK